MERQAKGRERVGVLEGFKGGGVPIERLRLTSLRDSVLHFALAFLLARGVVWGDCASFGVAYVAVAQCRYGGFASVLGVVVGYLTLAQYGSLQYLASAIIAFATVYALSGLPVTKRPYFPVLTSAAATACVGVAFWGQAGFDGEKLLSLCVQVTLCAGCAYFFNVALRDGKGMVSESEQISFSKLILIATVFLSLSPVTLVADMSLGRILSVLLTLVLACMSGTTGGILAGITCGIAMDLSSGGPLIFTASYCLCGLIAGLFQKLGRLPVCMAFLLANFICMSAGDGGFYMLYEAFAATVIFVCLPQRYLNRFAVIAPPMPSSDRVHTERVRRLLKHRLDSASTAFKEVNRVLSVYFDPPQTNKNFEDPMRLFANAASTVCRRCQMNRMCWDENYNDTKDALNNALPDMLKRGELEAYDFPAYFSSRCVKITDFIATVNNELSRVNLKRQVKAGINENRNILRTQYSDLAEILKSSAENLGANMTFDPEAEEKLQKYLTTHGIKAEVMCWRNSTGRLHVEIEGADISEIAADPSKIKERVSGILDGEMCEPEVEMHPESTIIRMSEAPLLMAKVGACVRQKEGESANGDSGTYFKDPEGRLYVLLSDGMGTGRGAAVQSATSLRLLERFLRSGIPAELSLRVINTALSLKDENGCFATLDVLCVNLYTGETHFYKYGAAPSYIKRARSISRIICQGFPAGTNTAEPDITVTRLKAGDTLVMVTDGISDGVDDDWLCELLSKEKETDADKLAEIITAAASEKGHGGDDMTAIVLQLESREKKELLH